MRSGRLRASRFAIFVWLLMEANHKTGIARTSPAQVAADLGFHPVTVRRDFSMLRRSKYIRYSYPPGGRQLCGIAIERYHDHFASEAGALQVRLQDRLQVNPLSPRPTSRNRRPKNIEVRSTTTTPLRVRSADGTDGQKSNQEGRRRETARAAATALREDSAATTPHAAGANVADDASSRPLTRDEALRQAPAALRETVEYFLFKTGRESVAPHELDSLQRLDEAHTPAVVQKAVTRAVERFRRRGEDAARLTLDYVWQSLQHFTTRKAPAPEPRRDPASHPSYPTGVTRLW
ncbi:MAG: hypothetical protein ACREKS_18155 [Candidatus Rokuibacteriota bacterium]